MKEAQGAAGFHFYITWRRGQRKRGSQEGPVPLTVIRPLAGPNWSHRGIAGTLRNVRPREEGQETRPVFILFSLGSQLAVALGKEKNIQTVKSRGKLEKLEPIFHLGLQVSRWISQIYPIKLVPLSHLNLYFDLQSHSEDRGS